MTAPQSTDNSVQLPAKHGVSLGGMRPVTIRQLLDATRQHSDAPFHIGDIEVHRISLVAHVVSVRTSGESLTVYELEDGTSRGRISARQWLSDADCDKLPENCDQLYVHIIGHLDRKVDLYDRNWVIAEHIHAVTDMPDRLFFHILETTFVTLSLERGPPPTEALKSVEPRNAMVPATPPVRRDAPATPGPSRVASSSSQPRSAVPTRIRNPDPPVTPSSPQQPAPRTPALQPTLPATPIRQPTPRRQPIPAISPSPSPPPSSPSPGPSGPLAPRTPSPPQRPSRTTAGSRRQPGIKRDPFADLTVLQRAILLQLMNAPPSEVGTDVSAIAIAVSHHDVSSDQVGAALDELVELGHIDSTIDDSHYAVKTSHYPWSS